MQTNLSQHNGPTRNDYETIFGSSEDVLDFTNTISNLFPDYIRNKSIDTNASNDRKITNQNNSSSNDGSEFQKELNSQLSFLKNLKQEVHPYAKNGDTDIIPKITDLNNIKSDQTKLSRFIKVDVVDAIVDSIVISILFPLASNQVKKSKFLYDTITQNSISSVNKEIIESEKVQKLTQKRIFLLSIGKLRPTPEESEQKKMRFIPASKMNLKSILKNPNPQSSTHSHLNEGLKDKSKDYSSLTDKKDNVDKVSFSTNSTGKPDSLNMTSNKNLKRVHFIPEKSDIIPENAVVFDYKESAKLMKKTREEEKAIRKREEEFMKKVKNDFMSKQKSTKNKYFTTTSSNSAYDYNISLKPKPKPRSRSAKAKPSKTKAANLSSSLYPSYYSPKTKSTVTSNSIEKDDRIRRKTPVRSHSPQTTFRSQYDENSNVMRKGKSSILKEKPKIKPKPKQSKPKPRSGYEF